MTPEEYYTQENYPVMDRFDKKTGRFSYYDLLEFAEEYHKKQLSLCCVSERYDEMTFKPPFRVGRKQGKAVLDANGLLVTFFNKSEKQAELFCDYLNNAH